MGWLKKLFGRQETHEQWLEKHPGKESTKSVPTAQTDAEQQATRARMEEEMGARKTMRDEP